MIEQMRISNFSEHTLRRYCRVVEYLAEHYYRCPSEISTEEVNAYLLHLIRDEKLSYSSVDQARYGIQFLYSKANRTYRKNKEFSTIGGAT